MECSSKEEAHMLDRDEEKLQEELQLVWVHSKVDCDGDQTMRQLHMQQHMSAVQSMQVLSIRLQATTPRLA